MDPVTAMLEAHRAERPFLLRCVLASPWSIWVQDRARLTLLAVTAGAVWLDHPTGRVRVDPDDLVLIRGPRPYRLAHDPDRDPDVTIEPGQVCRLADGSTVGFSRELGLRSWGNGARETDLDVTVMLTAVYELDGQIAGSVVDRLPEVAVLPGLAGSPVTAVLADELGREALGQDVIVDRLADLLLITALRAWFDDREHTAPAGWRAYDDEVVGPVLRLIHAQPADPWTVDALARAVRVSRATLARRFTELVGESPIGYLTRWRLGRGADLLTDPRATVSSVAAAVGYATPFAFSAAFKRELGVSPAEYRRTRAA